MVITYSRVWIYSVMFCQFCSWSAKQQIFFSCSLLGPRMWSHETGLALPSRVSLLSLHTQADLVDVGVGRRALPAATFSRRRRFSCACLPCGKSERAGFLFLCNFCWEWVGGGGGGGCRRLSASGGGAFDRPAGGKSDRTSLSFFLRRRHC